MKTKKEANNDSFSLNFKEIVHIILLVVIFFKPIYVIKLQILYFLYLHLVDLLLE